MKNGAQTKPGVTLTDMFWGFPLAYAVFILAAIVFGVFDFGSYIASATLQRPYERWLEISEPTTNGVARFVPAVDSATGYLQMYRGSYLIPAVRNIVFGGNGLALFIAFYFLTCFIVVRLMRRSEYLTTAVVKEQDDLNGGGEYD